MYMTIIRTFSDSFVQKSWNFDQNTDFESVVCIGKEQICTNESNTSDACAEHTWKLNYVEIIHHLNSKFRQII